MSHRPVVEAVDAAIAESVTPRADRHGIVHAPRCAINEQHPFAGWWVAACFVSLVRHETRAKAAEPVTCLYCLGGETHHEA